MKVSKIINKISISSNVEAQGCKDDCFETRWAGKVSAETSGCYLSHVYTPRNAFFM
jgi:hypothetical protein